MNILLILDHSIAEFDDVRMFSDLGYDVFSIGAYTNPEHPGDDLRPALRSAPYHPELEALVGDQLAAKANLPDELIEWADTIIVHHYLDDRVVRQWGRIRHKRVIWRTCGQSDQRLESVMAPLRADGLQIVRYSPAEQRYFEPRGAWAGQDALIRFGKYPSDYGAWDGFHARVANVTQDMRQRGDWVGLTYYLQATQGLVAQPVGKGSEDLPGGLGKLSYGDMTEYLASSRCYLYTGTIPASYTLGLIEALLTGVPVVSIGPDAWMGPGELLEAHELTGLWFDDPQGAKAQLRELLNDGAYAWTVGRSQREAALAAFSVDVVGEQWRAFLGDEAARSTGASTPVSSAGDAPAGSEGEHDAQGERGQPGDAEHDGGDRPGPDGERGDQPAGDGGESGAPARAGARRGRRGAGADA